MKKKEKERIVIVSMKEIIKKWEETNLSNWRISKCGVNYKKFDISEQIQSRNEIIMLFN